MNLPILLYLTDLIASLDGFCILISTLFFVFFIVIGFFYMITNDSYNEDSHKLLGVMLKKAASYVWIAFVCLAINIILPSQKTMYLMLGSSYLQNATLPKKIVDILEFKLDDVLKEMKEKDSKK